MKSKDIENMPLAKKVEALRYAVRITKVPPEDRLYKTRYKYMVICHGAINKVLNGSETSTHRYYVALRDANAAASVTVEELRAAGIDKAWVYRK